jgi:nickel/cobalt transporter (NicO) family protein
MIQIIISTFILSAIHATIPNHWIPIVAISKAERWSNRQTLWVTLISGISHTLSTILIGVLVGFAGFKLAMKYSAISEQVAPIILIGLGLIYIFLDRHNNQHHHSHDHEHTVNRKSSLPLLFSLSLSMFLTPCVEIEAYYFQAGVMGWKGIFMVSAIYVVTTLILMLFLVWAGLKGIKRLRSHTLEHHEKLITGSVLVVLGVIAYFVKF